MLRRLRLPLPSRLLAAGLLASLSVGLAAPAWAAERARAEWVVRAAMEGAAAEAAVERALQEAARTAPTPAAFAEAVVQALARTLPAEGKNPAAEALLRQLFGHLLAALAVEQGPQAVLAATSGASSPSPASSAGAPASVIRAPSAPARGTALPALVGPEPAPRRARPAVQPLGP